MKVLYIASNPLAASDLNLPQEINELQRFGTVAAEPNSFLFLPALRVEDLRRELRRHDPDVLHFAAHGTDSSLSLADERGRPVKLTVELLAALLPRERALRVIYLNACDSCELANGLVDKGTVAVAIGMTAPISNRAARSSAVAFYESLLAGDTIAEAFTTCQAMVRLLTSDTVSAQMYVDPMSDPVTEVMHHIPTLVADFDSEQPAADRDDEHYTLQLGLLGCPSNTIQVVFFTDDSSYINEDDNLEKDLCTVLRTAPVNGAIWMEDEYWRAFGDHRIFAIGIKADGSHFSTSSTLCKAIERRYRSESKGVNALSIKEAISQLRSNNGERPGFEPRKKVAKTKAGKKKTTH